ncbi:MAG: hypothetical protein R3A10_15025 [Caldilineaceae bacterium]
MGGETALPFPALRGKIPHQPLTAMEIKSRRPADWSPLLHEAWERPWTIPPHGGERPRGASLDLIGWPSCSTIRPPTPWLRSRPCSGDRNCPCWSSAGQADKDNELIVPVAEAGAGERLVLGVCEDKNYRTIVAAALAHGHLVNSRTPMDVNLAKQLIILIRDMGLDLNRILMDPSTGALGYGIEYGYSVMERLRIAALRGARR